MANTSLFLSKRWPKFIEQEKKSGRYGSTSAVVRDALQTLDEREFKLRGLKIHLALGSKQAANKDFVAQSAQDMLHEFKNKFGK